MAKEEMLALAYKIAAKPIKQDWTAQLLPKEDRENYDFVVLQVSKADRDLIVESLRSHHQDSRLRYFAQVVTDTFKKSEAAGFRSRDRQFAIDLLEKALSAPKANDGADLMPVYGSRPAD